MGVDQKENLKMLSAWMSVVTLPAILGLAAWGMAMLVDHEARLSVIEHESAQGPRYTANQAKTDLSSVKERINDHEERIRDLERQ